MKYEASTVICAVRTSIGESMSVSGLARQVVESVQHVMPEIKLYSSVDQT